MPIRKFGSFDGPVSPDMRQKVARNSSLRCENFMLQMFDLP